MWIYSEIREFPHLNCWTLTKGTLSVSVRLVVGCDYNEEQIRKGETKRLYSAHLTFPSRKLIGDVPMERHSIGMDLYRDSYDECKAYLEKLLKDLVFEVFVGAYVV